MAVIRKYDLYAPLLQLVHEMERNAAASNQAYRREVPWGTIPVTISTNLDKDLFGEDVYVTTLTAVLDGAKVHSSWKLHQSNPYENGPTGNERHLSVGWETFVDTETGDVTAVPSNRSFPVDRFGLGPVALGQIGPVEPLFPGLTEADRRHFSVARDTYVLKSEAAAIRARLLGTST